MFKYISYTVCMFSIIQCAYNNMWSTWLAHSPKHRMQTRLSFSSYRSSTDFHGSKSMILRCGECSLKVPCYQGFDGRKNISTSGTPLRVPCYHTIFGLARDQKLQFPQGQCSTRPMFNITQHVFSLKYRDYTNPV